MTVRGRFMRLGGMVESSVRSVLTRFDKNRPRFDGGRREEERGTWMHFCSTSPPHIWTSRKVRLIKLGRMVESRVESVLTKFGENH